ISSPISGCSTAVATGVFVVNFGVSKFTNSPGSDGSGRMRVRAPTVLEPQWYLNKEVRQGEKGVTNNYPRLPRRQGNYHLHVELTFQMYLILKKLLDST
ncbi:MAG: hypothetical protein EZS28_055990, partial [Streblomastix strix]